MAKWLHQRKGLLEGDTVWTSDDKVWTDIELSRDHDITNASGRTYTHPQAPSSGPAPHSSPKASSTAHPAKQSSAPLTVDMATNSPQKIPTRNRPGSAPAGNASEQQTKPPTAKRKQKHPHEDQEEG